MKKFFQKMFEQAMALNKKNILEFLENNPSAKLIDLGCDSGEWTMELAKRIDTKEIYGVDIIDERIKNAKLKGIKVYKSDLNEEFPFEDNFFDVVHANQVIEHISNLDYFISEIFRILKAGGYIIISTENGSSWHNIFASVMGWQIFSLTNVSAKKLSIGNPLSIHRDKIINLSSWSHKTIFNYRGLKEVFMVYNFRDIAIRGAGYYPLPAKFGLLDPRHAHFITLKAFKKT